MNILFLEDDSVISDNVQEFLNDTYTVTHAFNSSKALSLAEANDFDLYLFDVNVPGISGIKLLKTLREFNDATPTIFITAYKELKYLKDCFEAGANDFIRKPFELDELLIRIENIKKQFNIDEVVNITSTIHFNTTTNQLCINKNVVTISNKESALLSYLIFNKNSLVSLDELLQNLWNYEDMPSADTIRTYIKNLRHLIGKEHILNVRGKGYLYKS